MPKFAANLTMLFTEAPFIERFALARAAGFTHVEYLFPYPFKAEDLKAELDICGLTQILFNLPAGDRAIGRPESAASRLCRAEAMNSVLVFPRRPSMRRSSV